MARDKLTEYSATASENTVCGDVNIAENSALPSDMNNFAREVMSHLKNFSDGTDAIDALTVTGNLTVDTNTLHVDAANNRVGVGTTSPSQTIDAVATGSSTSIILAQNTTSNDGAAHLRAKNPQNTIILGTDNNSGGLTGTANSSFLYSNSTTPIIFMPNGTEKMRLLSGGGITFNGDTAAANALDDYEEGTFDCSIHDGTTTPTQTQKGYYVKIGKMVHIHGQTIISGSSSGGSLLRITLPFQVVSDSRGGIAHGVNQPISLATSGEYLGLISEINTSILYIVSHAFGGGHTHQNFNQLGTGLFSFGGTYRSD